MSRHVMAITYEPKVFPLRYGGCRQTIRRIGKKNISRGDVITFHGWQGRPYRSKWSWQKEVVVKEVHWCIIHEEGIATRPFNERFISGPVCHWEDNYCTQLAMHDFIVPPTGEALRDVLFSLNGAPKMPEKYIIIRW